MSIRILDLDAQTIPDPNPTLRKTRIQIQKKMFGSATLTKHHMEPITSQCHGIVAGYAFQHFQKNNSGNVRVRGDQLNGCIYSFGEY